MKTSWMYTEKQPCGTNAAFRRHIRHGERPCPECRRAQAEYQAQWYAAKRGTKGAARRPSTVPVQPRQPAWWCVIAGAGELEWDGQPSPGDRREMADAMGLDPWAGAQ